MVGSYAGGAAIVGGVFLLVLAILILLRKKLFRNTFVPMFIKLFFDDDK
jgi:prolipoprotein diacylglyceryltransferase